MALPNEQSILGQFDGVPVHAPGTKITPLKIGDRYYMDVSDEREPSRLSVDLVLASGRQHQTYLTRTPDEQYRFLPLIWATPTKQWILISEYRANSLNPKHADYWRNSDILNQGRCMTCHLSQMTVDVSQKRPRVAWVDLSINCEACHGPGRTHVEARKANQPDESYNDLLALTKHNDVKLCSKCHAAKWNLYGHGSKPNISEHVFATLADRGLRADGTQFSTTYQYAAQALSPCFLEGEADCSSCHDAHAQHARDLAGQTAAGEHSNRQCNVCHRDLMDSAAANKHSRHSSKIYCVDCHMSYSWISDSPKTVQKTSDHSVSIPHPIDTLKHGIPNACTSCHTDQSPEWALTALNMWGYKKATQSRPWLNAIAAGRKKVPDAAQQLIKLLEPDAPPMIIASALELLTTLEANPQVAKAVKAYVDHTSSTVRLFAIASLIAHDQKNAAKWEKLGEEDPSPFVRLLTFEYGTAKNKMSEIQLSKYLQDLLNHSHFPPLRELDKLVQVRMDRKEYQQALNVLELRMKYTSASGPGRRQNAALLEKLRTLTHP